MDCERHDDGLVLLLDRWERLLLADLIDLLREAVRGETESTPDDPFAFWEQQEQREFSDDPVVDRWGQIPDAAPGQERLRAFTHDMVLQQRLEDLGPVQLDLADAGHDGRIAIPADHVEAWLRTLNVTNLLLSDRLGIVDEISADEARRAAGRSGGLTLFHVHSWLTSLLGILLDELG